MSKYCIYVIKYVMISFIILAAPISQAYFFDYYGAIAYSMKTGHVGMSYNGDSPIAAARVALSGCREFPAANDCKLIFEFKNACVGFAKNDRGYAFGMDHYVVKAKRYALNRCRKNFGRGCEIKFSLCTTRW